ncbi:MAG: hypothetical protein Q7T03_11225 [Deltaproteobacteria bacterium]|nr:hypothetical protein [Deltaproteobacteria bacterium]
MTPNLVIGPLTNALLMMPMGLENALYHGTPLLPSEKPVFIDVLDGLGMFLKDTGVNTVALQSSHRRLQQLRGEETVQAHSALKDVALFLRKLGNHQFDPAAMATCELLRLSVEPLNPHLQKDNRHYDDLEQYPHLQDWVGQHTSDEDLLSIAAELKWGHPVSVRIFENILNKIDRFSLNHLFYFTQHKIAFENTFLKSPDGTPLSDELRSYTMHFLFNEEAANPLLWEDMWDHFADILKNHPLAVVRFHVLELIADICFRKKDPILKEKLFSLARIGLKDQQLKIAYRSQGMLSSIDHGESVRIFLDTALEEPWNSGIASDSFGIGVYVYNPFLHCNHLDWQLIFGEIRPDHNENFSLAAVAPIHSLADYQPSLARRKEVVAAKYRKVLRILKETGLDQDTFFRKYLLNLAFKARGEQGVRVARMPSGKNFLVQGHHTIAALLLAAANGKIPREWLEAVPFNVMDLSGCVEEDLAIRFLTGGVTLTWPDLFPPGRLSPLGFFSDSTQP